MAVAYLHGHRPTRIIGQIKDPHRPLPNPKIAGIQPLRLGTNRSDNGVPDLQSSNARAPGGVDSQWKQTPIAAAR